MKNKLGYSLALVTMMHCFSPMVCASDQKESFEELHKRYMALESVESQKVVQANNFFRTAPVDLPKGSYVLLEKPVFEHILLNVPASSVLVVDSAQELEKLLDLPFEKVRMAYYAHRSEVEYEFIANSQVIYKDKDMNVTAPVMYGIVQTLNAVGQKYFYKTQSITQEYARLQTAQFARDELEQKVARLQSLEADLTASGNAFFKSAAADLPAGRYVIVEKPVVKHILLKAPSSALLLGAGAEEVEELLALPFEKIRMAYYAHRSEIEYEFIANSAVIHKDKDEGITQSIMATQIVPSINAIAYNFFNRTKK